MKKYKFIIAFLILLVHSVCAQDYPVHVTTVLTPPYSLYLADYTSPESNSLQVIIHLRELDRPEYRVKLRITIEGMGITLRTKPAYMPPGLILQGGVPEMLTGADLRHYLNPDNLDFSGISRQEFMKRAAFPEGFYTFRIEVLDYVRNVVVSNPSFANAWMILNDPPLINFPANHEKVTASDPQNVMFNWTPLHSGSPNAAFTTEYEFTLVELYPEGRNPNDALRVAKPIFVTTTPSTSLNYGAMEPLLIPGRKYAFRVRAFDTSKRDLFKNNGFSEVFVFQFGDACVAPLNIKAEALDPNRIKLSWEPTEAHTSFIIQYKKLSGKEWDETTTYSNSVIIPGLQGGAMYEYRVSGSCGTIRGELSALASITTPTTKEDEFTCGAPSPAFEINTNPLIEDLKVDDLIKTADFEVSLTTVEKNSDGSYKGTGRALLPWMNFATVRVKFAGIRVNEEYRVYAGNVTTVYSKNSRFVAQLDLADEMKEDKKDSGGKETSKDKEEKFEGIEIPYEGDIETITVNPVTGEIIVANADGTTTVLPREKDKEIDQYEDVRITDSNGDKWVIDSNGNVTQEPSSTPPNAITSADSIDFTIRFAAHPDQQYGFDQKKDDNLGKYDVLKVRDQDYTIFWKSVETGQQDFVNAVADGKEVFPRIVGFRNSFGENASMPGTVQNEKQIIVTGQSRDEQTLTAYVKVKEEGKEEETEVEVGKLKVATYDKVRNKVIIVPVNDATAQDGVTLANAINSIFKQAVATWDVTVEERFTIDQEKLVGLDVGESGLLASFPAKCRDFNQEFRDQRDLDKDAYYLFLIKGSGSSRSGFMPFKRKFGYIFVDNLGGLSLSTTIAHELAHGAFRLRHTFSPEAFMAAEGSTDNLMDYKGGTELKKYQWDYVHDPESMNGWLQDDDESGQVAIGMSHFTDFRNTADGSFSFISPSGKYVTLPSSTKTVSFSTLDRLFKISNDVTTDEETNNQFPIGSLVGFTNKDGIIYTARLVNGTFAGYFKRGTQDKYEDAITGAIKPSNGIALFIGVEERKYVSYISKFAAVNGNSLPASSGYFSEGTNISDFTILDDLDFLANRQIDFKSWLTSNSKSAFKTVDNSSFNFSFPNQDVSLVYQIHKKPLKEFLSERLTEDKTLQDYLFYFTIINLKTNVLNAFDDCAKQQITLDGIRALETYHRVISTAMSGMSGRLNAASDIQRNFESATLKELFNKAYNQTKVIDQLEAAVSNKANAEALHEILKKEIGVCAYSGLKYETRRYLIQKLLLSDNDYWYVDPSIIGSDGNFILKQLLVNTPEGQRVKLLKENFLANNSEWLRKLWSEATTFANGVEFNDVLDIIYNLREWVLTYYSQLEIPITKRQIVTIITDPSSGEISFGKAEYPAGIDVFYLSSAGVDFTFNTTFSGKISPKPEAEFLESGKIRLAEHIYTKDNTTYISAPGTNINREKNYWYEGTFHPFEPITLHLVHGAEEVSQLPIGKTFQDIALMGLIYQNRINKAETDAAIRAIGNSAAIIAAVLAAPETGGSSLVVVANFITRLGGVVATMDIAIQQERDAITKAGQYDNYSEFFSTWDEFYTAVGVADLGAWGTIGITKLSKLNIANSANRFANAIKNTRNLPVRIVKSWNEAWGIASLENIFLTKLNNLGFTFLKNEFLALDVTTKSKFLSVFGEESIEILKAMDNKPKLVKLWIKYGNAFKTNSYITETGVFNSCQSVVEAHSHESYLGKLARKVMEGDPPSNSERVIVGVTHPRFEGKVFLGRNFKPGETSAKLEFLSQKCHPILRDRIEYMEFVRTSVIDGFGNVTNTKLANNLMSVDNLTKLTTAGEAGIHGEIRALSDALYELEKTTSVTEQTLLEFDMFIRDISNNIMQRCPCCFQVTSGVKVLGGR